MRFQVPVYHTDSKTGCYHLYPLRIKGITEQQRDAIMKEIFDCDVSVNVHFIPVPAMTFYKNLGYDLKNYPVTYDNFSREISLPVFYNLTDEQINEMFDLEFKTNCCNCIAIVLYSFGDIVEQVLSAYFGTKGLLYFFLLYLGGIFFSTLFDFRKYKKINHETTKIILTRSD